MNCVAASYLSLWIIIIHLPNCCVFVVGWMHIASVNDDNALMKRCFVPWLCDTSVVAASCGRPRMGIVRRLEMYDACPFSTLEELVGELTLEGAKNPWGSLSSDDALLRRWVRYLLSSLAHLIAMTSVFIWLFSDFSVRTERKMASLRTVGGEIEFLVCFC